MWDATRELREAAVQGLAKVGLVWSLAVLAALFMVSAAQGHDGSAYSLAASDVAHLTGGFGFDTAVDGVGSAPRTPGLALALTVLAGGITVLTLGALKAPRASVTADSAPVDRYQGHDVTLPMTVPLAFGLARPATATAA